MNQESQNTEWKEVWHDEYLKWVCGFANAQGGKIYIGKNDEGVVIGVPNAVKLMEDLPNKVRDILGIIVDVNLLEDDSKAYLEIVVEAYPYPISYKGQYHYRSGSTKQELKGAALDKFLLRKHGIRWDAVPVPYVSTKDLSQTALNFFKKNAIKSKRLDNDILQDSDAELLEKLRLIEGQYLKRATVLLFHPDPEKYVTGAYIKIGFFRTDTDLLFQDEIHGNLFEQLEKAMDLLLTKYLKAIISYEGLFRRETYPIPETVLREALLNAVAHKDYGGCNPIQISVYANKIMMWNEGQLPEDWTIVKLTQKHPSAPYNPSIANAFFRAGLVEAWGNGTLRMIDDCVNANAPIPLFRYDYSGFILDFSWAEMIVSYKDARINSEKDSVISSEEMLDEIIRLMKNDSHITIAKLAKVLNVNTRTVQRFISLLKSNNKIIRKDGKKLGEWEVL